MKKINCSLFVIVSFFLCNFAFACPDFSGKYKGEGKLVSVEQEKCAKLKLNIKFKNSEVLQEFDTSGTETKIAEDTYARGQFEKFALYIGFRQDTGKENQYGIFLFQIAEDKNLVIQKYFYVTEADYKSLRTTVPPLQPEILYHQ